MEWINVKDWLPKNIDTVLIVIDYKDSPPITEPAHRSYKDESKTLNCWNLYTLDGAIIIHDNDVTHWQPLPQPPEEKKDK